MGAQGCQDTQHSLPLPAVGISETEKHEERRELRGWMARMQKASRKFKRHCYKSLDVLRVFLSVRSTAPLVAFVE